MKKRRKRLFLVDFQQAEYMPGSENSSEKFFYVYVLESLEYKELYIGYTADLRKRFTEHNEGKSRSTRPYLPWKLVYYEACRDEDDALRRERYLKTSQGSRLLKRRLKEYLYKKAFPKSNT